MPESTTPELSRETNPPQSGPLSGRSNGLELLRILAMLMIVVLHYLNPYMGGALANTQEGTFNYILIHAIESMCIIGPNCFVLITGYFMVTRTSVNLRKLVDIYLCMLIYALGFFALVRLFVPSLISANVTWRRLLVPFLTGDRWFVKAYFILYLLAPFLSRGLLSLGRKSYRTLLIILLCLFSLWYTFLPGAPATDGGYGFINFILLYCIAGYMRLHMGETKKILPFAALFLLCAALVCAAKLGGIEKAWHYSYILNVAGSVAIFLLFKGLKLPHSRVISALAPRTFGVFLIHADISIAYILYRVLLHTQLFWNSPWLFAAIALSSVTVFLVAAAIDKLRAVVSKYTLDRLLDRIALANIKIDAG